MSASDIILVEFHEVGRRMKACFIGHRNIDDNEKLKFLLIQTVVDLICKGVTTFLFGSKSEFDDLSWEVVTSLKNTYPYIKRVYVRSAYQYISKPYEKYLLGFYEETYFPAKLENAGKYTYVERNYAMIDNSTYCVFYYNENYVVPLKRRLKSDMLLQRSRSSGTKIAYNYAVKKSKVIINLFR
ncbi:MAG: hypothetical protein IKL77_04070 [Clostridia bacterium]|nr:hypothetical protein [Clostridia bacterium]